MCICRKDDSHLHGYCLNPDCPLLLPFQREFIESTARITVLIGGVGCGKTTAAQAAAARHKGFLFEAERPDANLTYRPRAELKRGFSSVKLLGLMNIVFDDLDQIEPRDYREFKRAIAPCHIWATARNDDAPLVQWLLTAASVRVITASMYDNPYLPETFKTTIERYLAEKA